MPRLTISMDQEMFDALAHYAEGWGQSLAALVRLGVQDVLQRPEVYHELLAETRSHIEDLRTPEQIAAWEEHEPIVKGFDLNEVLTQTPHRAAIP